MCLLTRLIALAQVVLGWDWNFEFLDGVCVIGRVGAICLLEGMELLVSLWVPEHCSVLRRWPVAAEAYFTNSHKL